MLLLVVVGCGGGGGSWRRRGRIAPGACVWNRYAPDCGDVQSTDVRRQCRRRSTLWPHFRISRSTPRFSCLAYRARRDWSSRSRAGSCAPSCRRLASARVVRSSTCPGIWCSRGEQGLLGLAFDPNFATNRFIYVNYSRRADGATIVARYTWDVGTDIASPRQRKDHPGRPAAGGESQRRDARVWSRRISVHRDGRRRRRQ